MGDKVISSIISILLRVCRPLAVARLVVFGAIYSVYRVFFGGWVPHVAKKVFKFMPSFAHSNALSSIVFKADIFSVITPLFHTGPNPVYSSFSHSVRWITVTFGGAHALVHNVNY